VPAQFADLITSEDWDAKITKIDTAIQDWIGPGKFNRALGELCYCIPGVGSLFDKFDERGYGEHVNARRKEVRALLKPIVESLSDHNLVWSLEWEASYPEENCMYKDQVDQLVERYILTPSLSSSHKITLAHTYTHTHTTPRDAWKNLTELPSGFTVSLKFDVESPPDEVPVEDLSYNLNLVVRRRYPLSHFVMPPFELDPEDPMLAFIPGTQLSKRH